MGFSSRKSFLIISRYNRFIVKKISNHGSVELILTLIVNFELDSHTNISDNQTVALNHPRSVLRVGRLDFAGDFTVRTNCKSNLMDAESHFV